MKTADPRLPRSAKRAFDRARCYVDAIQTAQDFRRKRTAIAAAVMQSTLAAMP